MTHQCVGVNRLAAVDHGNDDQSENEDIDDQGKNDDDQGLGSGRKATRAELLPGTRARGPDSSNTPGA
jgi:hypothetical protein